MMRLFISTNPLIEYALSLRPVIASDKGPFARNFFQYPMMTFDVSSHFRILGGVLSPQVKPDGFFQENNGPYIYSCLAQLLRHICRMIAGESGNQQTFAAAGVGIKDQDPFLMGVAAQQFTYILCFGARAARNQAAVFGVAAIHSFSALDLWFATK